MVSNVAISRTHTIFVAAGTVVSATTSKDKGTLRCPKTKIRKAENTTGNVSVFMPSRDLMLTCNLGDTYTAYYASSTETCHN